MKKILKRKVQRSKKRLLFLLRKYIPDIRIELLNVKSLYPGAIASYTLNHKYDRGFTDPVIYMPIKSLLSAKTIDFVVFHEIGHLINAKKHLTDYRKTAEFNKKSDEIYYNYNQLHEYDADDFAVKVLGLHKTVAIMREFLELSLKKYSKSKKAIPSGIFKLKYRLLRLECFLSESSNQ